jgi:serine/threonine protein kinase
MSKENQFEFSPAEETYRQPEHESTLESSDAESLDNYIKSKIIHSAQKINEGNSGVIGLIDLSDLPEEMRAKFFGDRAGSKSAQPDKFAVKTLKIYEPGAGDREFRLHQEATQIIAASGQEDLAKVPQMYYYRQLNIDQNDKELVAKLESDKIDISAGKFDVMIMDYINGDDFNSYIFKQVIINATDRDLFSDAELIKLRERLQANPVSEKINYEPLAHIASDLLSLKPGLDQGDYRLNVQLESENHARLVEFLQARSFRLDAAKLATLSKTVKLLNKNGFFHRDLHGRNIMVDYDAAHQIKDYYILDFGLAVSDGGIGLDNPYIDDASRRYTNDNFLPDIYAALTKDKPKPGKKEDQEFLASLDLMRGRIKTDARSVQLWPELSAATSLDGLSTAIKNISGVLVRNEQDSWEIRYALLAEVAETDPRLVQDYIAANIDKVPLSVRNGLVRLRRLIKT